MLLLALALALTPDSPAQSWESSQQRADLERTRSEERDVLGEIESLDRELMTLKSEQASLQVQGRELEAAHRRHADEVASAQAKIERERGSMTRLVRALYRLRRRGLARTIFGVDEPADIRRRATYIQAILTAYMGRFQRFAESLAARSQARERVQRDIEALGAVRAEQQLKVAELREQRSRRLETLGTLRTQADRAARALRDYETQRREFSGHLSRTVTPAPARPTSSGTTVPACGDTFRKCMSQHVWPTTGRLQRRFGTYTDPSTSQRVESYGIDIAAEYGTPVRSIYPGVVKMASIVRGYGQTVAVNHGAYDTIYAHLGSTAVRRGQAVRLDDVLGTVGNSGLTDGAAHVLTFEVRYHGTPNDPLRFLAPR